MANPRIKAALEARYPEELASHIISSFTSVEQNYRLEKWKTSELDAGHFVEAARRLIEFELFGSYTAFDKELGSFNPTVLTRYEHASGSEELRIIVPRVLYSIYCVRNKRGVGHLTTISPNKLDATFILNSVKWVVGELIRLASETTPDLAKSLVDEILFRHVDLVWDDGETFMVLAPNLFAPDKALLVLYRQDRLHVDDLRKKVEYTDKSKFKKILAAMQVGRYIHVDDAGIVKISPVGVQRVESILLRQQ